MRSPRYECRRERVPCSSWTAAPRSRHGPNLAFRRARGLQRTACLDAGCRTGDGRRTRPPPSPATAFESGSSWLAHVARCKGLNRLAFGRRTCSANQRRGSDDLRSLAPRRRRVVNPAKFLLVLGIDAELWAARHDIQPFTVPCDTCGRPMTTTIPFAWRSLRGLIAAKCSCGSESTPYCVVRDLRSGDLLTDTRARDPKGPGLKRTVGRAPSSRPRAGSVDD